MSDLHAASSNIRRTTIRVRPGRPRTSCRAHRGHCSPCPKHPYLLPASEREACKSGRVVWCQLAQKRTRGKRSGSARPPVTSLMICAPASTAALATSEEQVSTEMAQHERDASSLQQAADHCMRNCGRKAFLTRGPAGSQVRGPHPGVGRPPSAPCECPFDGTRVHDRSGDALDDGHDALDLGLRRHRRGRRSGGLTADVNDVSALGLEAVRVCDRVCPAWTRVAVRDRVLESPR